MKVIICIDDNYGLLFNNRRLSRDKAIITDIYDMINENKIWISSFSRDLFQHMNRQNIIISDDYMLKAGHNDFVFVENADPAIFDKEIVSLIIYRWNCRYPSDLKCTIQLNNDHWKEISTYDFEGTSHEKITKEIYMRGEN